MADFRLEIISAERIVYQDEVKMLVAPGMEGVLGILAHHAALLTALQPGELRIIKEGREEESMAISGGFLEVMANKVVVLADAAERAEEIDAQRAEAAMKKAQERLSMRAADVDLERAMASLRRSQVRLRVAQRRRAGRREQSNP